MGPTRTELAHHELARAMTIIRHKLAVSLREILFSAILIPIGRVNPEDLVHVLGLLPILYIYVADFV